MSFKTWKAANGVTSKQQDAEPKKATGQGSMSFREWRQANQSPAAPQSETQFEGRLRPGWSTQDVVDAAQPVKSERNVFQSVLDSYGKTKTGTTDATHRSGRVGTEPQKPSMASRVSSVIDTARTGMFGAKAVTTADELERRIGETRSALDNMAGSMQANSATIQSAYEGVMQAQTKFNELDEYRKRLEPRLQGTDPADVRRATMEYNALIPRYNQALQAYQQAAGAYNGMLPGIREADTQYQNLVTAYNNDLEQYNALSARGDKDYKLLQKQADDVYDRALELSRLIQDRDEFKPNRGTTIEEMAAWQEETNRLREEYRQLNAQASELQQQANRAKDRNAGWQYDQLLASVEQYRDNPDWATKSQADPKMMEQHPYTYGVMGSQRDLGYQDDIYAIINGSQDAYLQSIDAESINANDKAYLRQMNERERAAYNYLYATQGKEKANAFLKELTPTLTERQRGEDQKWWQAEAEAHPWGASAFSVLASPLKAISFFGQAADLIDDGTIDQNASYNKFSHIPKDIRAKVAERWGEEGSFLYQTGMSMADFLFNSLITGELVGMGGGLLEGSTGKAAQLIAKYTKPALLIMGTEAAADTVIDLRDRGVDSTRAMALGVVAGLAEIVTENVSLENLLNPELFADGARKYILKNMLAEGSEELASDLINWAADDLMDVITGQREAEWRQDVRKNIADGMDVREATQQVLLDRVKQAGLDALGGALSGGVMAGGSVGINYGLNTERAQAARAALNATRADLREARAANAPVAQTEAQEMTTPQAEEMQTPAEPPAKRTPLDAAMAKISSGEELTQNDAKRIMQDSNAMQTLQDAGVLPETVRNDAAGRMTVRQAVQQYAQQIAQQETAQQAQETQETEAGDITPTEETPRTDGLRLREQTLTPALQQDRLTIGQRTEANVNGQQTETAAPAAAAEPAARAEGEQRTAGTQAEQRTAEFAGRQSARGDGGRGSGLGRFLLRSFRENYRGARGTQQQRGRAHTLRAQAEARGRLTYFSGDQITGEGTTEKLGAYLPEDMQDDELKQTIRDYAAKGVTLTPILGQIGLKNGNRARAYVSNDGKHMWVQVDHGRLSWQQLVAHEELHRELKVNPGLRQEIIKDLKSDPEIAKNYDRILRRYVEAYAKMGVTDAADIEEEMLADYRAGFDMIKERIGSGVIRAKMKESIRGTERRVSENGEVTVVDGVAMATNEANTVEVDPKPFDETSVTGDASIETFPDWAKNYIKNGGDAQEIIDQLRRFTEQMVANDVIYGYVPSGRYAYNSEGPLRKNDEYVRTFDMDASCPRTFQFLAYRNKLRQMAGRPLTYNESIQLVELMRAYGQQIPCTYCYVENKRILLDRNYLNWFDYRNAVLSADTDEEARTKMYSYNPSKGTLTSGATKQLAAWRQGDRSYQPSAVDVWTAMQTAKNSVFNYLDGLDRSGALSRKTPKTKIIEDVCKEFGVTEKAAQDEVSDYVSTWIYDRDAQVPHQYAILNDTDVSEIDQQALVLHRTAMSYANSASSARGVDNYMPYTDQLKNFEQFKKRIMAQGGIRKHSSNDFRIDYVQDYFLFFADLAAGKWTGHTYTKNADYVRIFGRTGDRINISVAFTEENGKIRENWQEGMGWRDAQQLRRDYYDNVGVMAMVTSNAQLSYALNADWIDMIIPFHSSGLDKAVWYDLRGWFDFTSKQHERFLNADQMKQALRDKGVEVPKGAKAQEIKALYDETFSIKHIVNEEGKEIVPHFLPGSYEVNGQTVPGHNNDIDTYMKLCREYGVIPRFQGILVDDGKGNQVDVTEHPNYMKLVKETARTETEQKPIQFNFNEYDEHLGMSPFEYAMQRMEEEARNGGYENTAEDPYGIVDEFAREYLGKNKPLTHGVDAMLTERARDHKEQLAEMQAEEEARQAKVVQDSIDEGAGKASIQPIVGLSGAEYGRGVYLDSTLLENLDEDQRVSAVVAQIRKLGGQSFTAYDSNGEPVEISIATADRRFKNKQGKSVAVNHDLTQKYTKLHIKQEAVVLADELIQASYNRGSEPAHNPHDWLDANGANPWDKRMVYLQEKNGSVWRATLHIANTVDGEKILYDVLPVEPIEMAEQRGKSRTSTAGSYDTTSPENVNPESGGSASREVDPEILRELNRAEESGDVIHLYRTMEVVEDENGRKALRSPMADTVKLKANKGTKGDNLIFQTPPFGYVGEDGNVHDLDDDGNQTDAAWFRADEHPEAATMANNEPWVKGKNWASTNIGKSAQSGSGNTGVAYNPYNHASNYVLNDQFTTAYKRPGLVTVEVIVPKSEANGEYWAEFAKDPVGWADWKSGEVANALRAGGKEPRRLFLSRWMKVARVVPAAEVADRIVNNDLKGTNVKIPANVVTQELRDALTAIDPSIIGAPQGQFQKDYYERQSEGKASREIDADYLAAVESGDMETAQRMVDEAAKNAGAMTLPGGKRKPYYHGTVEKFTVFDINKAEDGTFGYGFYFSPMKSKAEGYGDVGTYYLMTDRIATREDHNITPEQILQIRREYGLKTGDNDIEKLASWLENANDMRVMLSLESAITRNTDVEPAEFLQKFREVFGYDGLRQTNETVLFDNKLIKSADPVTYDDDGNVIPLSERFNAENEDIRYSLENMPSESLVFRPPTQRGRGRSSSPRSQVSRVRTHAFELGGLYNEVEAQMAETQPEEFTYPVESEKESMARALNRLRTDFEGEVRELPTSKEWDGEDLDTAMGILYQYRQQGRETGDYRLFHEWSHIIQEKGTKGGKLIQSFAKYSRTATGVAQKAAENLRDQVGKLTPAQQKRVEGHVNDIMGAIDGAAQEAAEKATDRAKGPKGLRVGPADQRAKDAENVIRQIHEIWSRQYGRNHGVPVEDWTKETGDRLADKIASRLSDPGTKTQTTMQTILGDLVTFAQEHALPTQAARGHRTALDRITDYLNNREAYAEAWSEAKQVLRDMYADDAEKLEALESFLNATISYNGDDFDRTMFRAILEASDLLGMSKQDILNLAAVGTGESVINRIADEFVKRVGVDDATLRDTVRRHLENVIREGNVEGRLERMESEASKALDIKIQELLRESRRTKADAANAVAQYLINDLGISGTDAAIAADHIAGHYMDQLQQRADKVLERMFAEKKAVTKKQRDKLMDLIRLGGLTNSSVEDAVVDALGLNKVSREKQRQIMDSMAQFADTLDAMADDDLEGLRSLIRQQAAVRNTKLDRLAEKVLSGETDAEYLRSLALAQLDLIAADYRARTAGEKVSTIQVISHLLNARTAMRNLGSNQIFDLVDSLANNAGLLPDMIMGQITGQRSVGLNKSWASKQKRQGAIKGAGRNLLEIALDAAPNDRNQSKYGTGGRRTFSMANSGTAGKILSKLEQVLGYELNTTDEFHKGSVFGETIESLARWVDEGYMTMEEAEEFATEMALYRSFQDSTIVGSILGGFKDVMNIIGTGKTNGKTIKGMPVHDWGLGDFVVKYTQVPGALVHRAIEYSPVGYLKAIYNIAQLANAKHKGESTIKQQRKAALALGRATTGTGLITLFALLAKLGLLRRGDDEKDQNAAALKASQGLGGTQLNLTAIERLFAGESTDPQQGDVLADIGFLEPLDSLMTIAALINSDPEVKDMNLYEFFSSPQTAKQTLGKSLQGIWLALEDTSAMQTLSNIYSTVRYHDEENDLPLYMQIPIEIASSNISGFIPAPVRQLAQATDTTYRDQYRSQDLFLQTGAKIANALPGLRQKLAPKLTPTGEPKQYQKPVLNALNATLNPGNINVYNSDEVRDELLRVYDATGDGDVLPARNAPYSINIGNESYTLTPDERTQYLQLRGSTESRFVEDLLKADWYRNADTDTQAGALNYARNLANDVAKVAFAEERGIKYYDTSYRRFQKMLREGVSPADVIRDAQSKVIDAVEAGVPRWMYDETKAAFNDIKNEELTSYEKGVAQLGLINDLDLTDEQKLTVYESLSDAESRADKFRTVMDTGLDFRETSRIYNKYAELNAGEDAKAAEKAKAFALWVDTQDLTKEQKQTIKDEFKYWQIIPTDTQRYDKLQASGFSPEVASRIDAALSGLQPLPGHEGVSNIQKYKAALGALGSGATKKEKMSVVEMFYGGDKKNKNGDLTQWGKINKVVDSGVTVEKTMQMVENDTLDVYCKWMESEPKKKGVQSNTYISFVDKYNNTSSTRDANGKEVKGETRKDKMMSYINGLSLSAEQKDSLFLEYYAESGLKDTPWHKGGSSGTGKTYSPSGLRIREPEARRPESSGLRLRSYEPGPAPKSGLKLK